MQGKRRRRKWGEIIARTYSKRMKEKGRETYTSEGGGIPLSGAKKIPPPSGRRLGEIARGTEGGKRRPNFVPLVPPVPP